MKFIFVKSLSNYLNLREPFLKLDYDASVSLAPIYDADLENFWTQKSNLHFKALNKELFLNLFFSKLIEI